MNGKVKPRQNNHESNNQKANKTKDKVCTADTGVAIEIKREAKRPEHKMKKSEQAVFRQSGKSRKGFLKMLKINISDHE